MQWWKSLLVIVVIAFSFYRAIPFFAPLLFPIPKFEELTVVSGTIQIEGEWSIGRDRRQRPPRYYLLTAPGKRIEFHCRYVMAPLECFRPDAEGHQVTLWMSRIHGVLQYEFTPPPPKGTARMMPYATLKAAWFDEFRHGPFLAEGVVFFVFLAFYFYWWYRLKYVPEVLERFFDAKG